MKKEIADRWVAALRSGQYEQGKGALKRDGKYCCLGVLEGPVLGRDLDSSRAALSVKTMTECDIYNLFGASRSVIGKTTLASMNDTENKSFAEIADYIEKNYQDL